MRITPGGGADPPETDPVTIPDQPSEDFQDGDDDDRRSEWDDRRPSDTDTETDTEPDTTYTPAPGPSPVPDPGGPVDSADDLSPPEPEPEPDTGWSPAPGPSPTPDPGGPVDSPDDLSPDISVSDDDVSPPSPDPPSLQQPAAGVSIQEPDPGVRDGESAFVRQQRQQIADDLSDEFDVDIGARHVQFEERAIQPTEPVDGGTLLSDPSVGTFASVDVPEAVEDEIRDRQMEEAGIDPDGPQRETWVGQQLEGASDWWQSGAERVGEATESLLPGTPVVVPDTQTGVPVVTDEDIDDVGRRGVQDFLEWIDPAGSALFAGDAALFAADEYEDLREHQDELFGELGEMDVRDDPFDYAETFGEATFGVGHIRERGEAGAAVGAEVAAEVEGEFAERPIETSAGIFGAGAAAIVGPTAAVRGARRAGDVDLTPRRDMFGTGVDRGQMDLTITRQRTRDVDDLPVDQRPADPTATTPEGRTPPRDAFPSEEAYQQALRRREDEIVRELAGDQPRTVDPDATPVERVRAQRDLFADHAEYQRELQAAREQMQAAQLDRTSDIVGPFGDPTGLEESVMGVTADPGFETDLTMGVADPTGFEETTVDAVTEPATTEDTHAVFGEIETQEEATTEAVVETETGLFGGTGTVTEEATETVVEEQTAVTETMAPAFGVGADLGMGETTMQAQGQMFQSGVFAGQDTVTRVRPPIPIPGAGRADPFDDPEPEPREAESPMFWNPIVDVFDAAPADGGFGLFDDDRRPEEENGLFNDEYDGQDYGPFGGW